MAIIVLKVTGESRARTPERTGTKKACSTPTSDEVTLTDMTLDASCIQSRAGACADETLSAAPVMKMAANRAGTSSSSKPASMLPPRPVRKTPGGVASSGIKTTSGLSSALKTVKKQVKELETSAANADPDDITDEMMDRAYTT